MFDIAATIALHFSLVLAVAVIVRWQGGRTIDFRPIVIGLVCSAVYWLMLIVSGDLQDHVPLLAGLKWNWVGKIAAIATSLLLLATLPMLSGTTVGLTWRQRPRSLGPALVVTALLCLFSWAVEAWAADGTDTSPERLLYQATMPGLDEELFMRGILLSLFVQGFGRSRERLGASFGLAEAAVTFLFAAGHGLRIADGAIMFDPLVFVVTGLLGAGFAWLRQRTGSLVVPIFAHNLINFGNSFF